MSEIFRIGHESNDFSEYDSSSTGNDLTTSASAGMVGTYGVIMDADVADTDSATVNISTFTTTSGYARLGFYFNKNTIASTGSSGDEMEVWDLTNGAGSFHHLRAFIHNAGGSLHLYIRVPGGSDVDGGVISTGNLKVEVVYQRATDTPSSDGICTLYIDDVQKDQITSINNYSTFPDINNGHFVVAKTEAGPFTGNIYLDEFVLRDDNLTVFQNYSYIASSGGLAKNALAVSADGNNVFIALEDNSTGNQIVFKATRPSSPTVSAIYDPGGGSAANVVATGDPDKMIFFGNFGTDVGVNLHTISSDTESDISPSSLGTDEVEPLAIDPSDINHLVACLQTAQDAIETEDGSTWSTLNAALGQTVEAMGVMWFGALFPFGAFIGGDDATDENLEYTPNEFANLREDTSAALQAVTKITGIDLVVG